MRGPGQLFIPEKPRCADAHKSLRSCCFIWLRLPASAEVASNARVLPTSTRKLWLLGFSLTVAWLVMSWVVHYPKADGRALASARLLHERDIRAYEHAVTHLSESQQKELRQNLHQLWWELQKAGLVDDGLSLDWTLVCLRVAETAGESQQEWREMAKKFIFIITGLLFEELVFRGFLFGSFKQRLGPWAAVLLSSLLFAACHVYSASGTLGVLLAGLIFGFIRLRTGSLAASFLAHAMCNAVFVVKLHSMTLY